jgi:hypothetical protein
MSDIADVSDKNIETFINSAIANASRHTQLHSDGHCAFCDEQVDIGMVFCNKDCRDDYDKQQRIRNISGN